MFMQFLLLPPPFINFPENFFSRKQNSDRPSSSLNAGMDSVISAALEEICYHGTDGVPLSSLWNALPPPLSPALKSSFWARLLSIPALTFTLPNQNTTFLSSDDPKIHRFEDAETLNLRIRANQQLRDSFVGLYDIPSSDTKPNQLRALARIALSREEGITQNEVAKELKIDNNNFFYVLKNLECRGLIVKQPAVVKGKDNASVTTNLLYLSRYAKQLGFQQRFEINSGDDLIGQSSKDNVLVRDYFPAMEAVCDKLEKSNDKVLVVSDIKQDLGYSGNKGHRAWRSIYHRLKEVGVVEEFEANVNEKIERCLRLLKRISSQKSEPNTWVCGDSCGKEEAMKFGRSIQQTDQLVELSLDHQIYDIIDAGGTDGTTYIEMCRRLGLDKKRNYPRFDNIVSRFGMHRQAESHLKTHAYRVWTSGNSNSKAPNAFLRKSKSILGENNVSDLSWDVDNINATGKLCEVFLLEDNTSTADIDSSLSGKENNSGIEFSHRSPKDGKADHVSRCPGHASDVLHDPNAVLDLVSLEIEGSVAPSEITPSNLSTPPSSGSHKAQHYPLVTTDGTLRERRILERLQEEKFLLRADLYKWLVSLEKDKCTTMDRKTVDRILQKLENQGHCKCVHINVPVVTNCSRSRTTLVVLHPSVQSFPPELLGAIHDKLRSFEKQVRGQGSKWKIDGSLPVLNGVARTRVRSDENTIKLEAMRVNGFVFPKMGRARLLHMFLWDHISNFPGWEDVLSSGMHSCTHRLFELEAAVKAIPVELFLQVAGSTRKSEDVIEKCKRGLRLSDLAIEEYRLLMDTLATGRLSLIIDILRRLKLIRLVPGKHSDDRGKFPHTTFRHAMELKPYVEEPLSVVAVSNLKSLDLRPRIRHDFVLSNREAVDEYWKTLEYCYAVAYPRAAKVAFPGSAVPEVFHHRSWTSVKAMSADQRAELQKLVVKDDSGKMLSYKECEKIAKDLSLSLQQVLRVYCDKYHQRLERFQANTNEEDHQHPKKNRLSHTRKRKKSLESGSVKARRVDSEDEPFDEQGQTRLPDTVNPLLADKDVSSEELDLETVGRQGQSKVEGCYPIISQYAFSKKPTRQSRFSWTDEADRQLLIQYVRIRAALGAKVHRIDWTVLHDLPGPPEPCARRIASLKMNEKFKTALMKLCTILSERYAKQLGKTLDASVNDNDCRVLTRSSIRDCLDNKSSNDDECIEEAGSKEERWDDFDETDVRKAFEDVLHCKHLIKLEVSREVGSESGEWSNLNTDIHECNPDKSDMVPSIGCADDVHIPGPVKQKESTRRSRNHRIHERVNNLLNEGTSVTSQVHNSLAVSNAVELLKLVFLSMSTAPMLLNNVAETLRRYSEHDLFAAFSYVREKKIMIGGSGGQPFLLSQHFLHSLSKSPFPANTGKRAARFSSWLSERQKDLAEGAVSLTADLQCGDIFELFALVSSGELSISPCMPDDGVGEAEDLRSLKRKSEEDDIFISDKAKKLKSLADSELISRREKGFPGLMVLLHHATLSTISTVELFKGGGTRDELLWKDNFNTITGHEISCFSSHCDEEIANSGSVIPPATLSSKSPWEAMAGYLEYFVSLPSDSKEVSLNTPEVFRTVYSSVQKAGDQGLSMEEVSQVVRMPGISRKNVVVHIVDILQTFGRVLKVNGYASICVVDALYRSKYFLTSSAGFRQDVQSHSLTKSTGEVDDGKANSLPENYNVLSTSSPREMIISDHDMHKVTILNLPEEFVPLNEVQNSIVHESHLQEDTVPSGKGGEAKTHQLSYGELCVPILPWINVDGTINKVVYNGLVRRVVGIVMQNPGILEEHIIRRIDALNPQSCKRLLELMVLDKHLIIKKMQQSTSDGSPALLRSILGKRSRESRLIYREHFFANPMSASVL